MATGLFAAEANSILDALGAEYSWVQLHIGDPGANGTANVAGETDRVQVTWSPAAGGVLNNANVLEWVSVAASEDYTHLSVWTLASGGACGFTGAVTANAVTANDTFSIGVGDVAVSLAVMA